MVHRVGSCVGECIEEMKCQEKKEYPKRKENNIYLYIFMCLYLYIYVFFISRDHRSHVLYSVFRSNVILTLTLTLTLTQFKFN